jgi:serine/threonine protein kinase
MAYQPGQEILNHKYRIEKLIGQGAYGDVYLVTHLGLNVLRAVKVLRRDAPGIGSTDFNHAQERFQLEAQLGARLNTHVPNPHLLQVFNFESQDDLLLLEMEYAAGGNLAERIQKAREKGENLPVGWVVQMGLEVAEGLAALHAMDIIHRDLKPNNILFDDQGHARLADLGLAQIPGGPSLRSQLSQPAPHPGTPGYMSPEQEQSGLLLRPASDVYSLGIVLFEALTGRNYNYLEPGTLPSDLRPDVPEWLDELLGRMLSEDLKERPWNGTKASELLKKGMEQKTPMSSGPVSTPRTIGLSKRLLPLGLIIILLGISIPLGLWLFNFGSKGQTPLAGLATRTESPTFTSTQTYTYTLPPTLTQTLKPTKTLTYTPAMSPTSTPSATITPLCGDVQLAGTWRGTETRTNDGTIREITWNIVQNGCSIESPRKGSIIGKKYFFSWYFQPSEEYYFSEEGWLELRTGVEGDILVGEYTKTDKRPPAEYYQNLYTVYLKRSK